MTAQISSQAPGSRTEPVGELNREDLLRAAIPAHEAALTRFLRGFTDNNTVLEDLRQETYLEACKSLPTFRLQGSFWAWMRRIACRVGYRHWARQAKEARAKAAYSDQIHSAPPRRGVACPWEKNECIEDCLQAVSPCERILLEMKYLQGFTTLEIARRLGWNEVRVRVRLHRCLKRIHARHNRRERPGG